ncbi:MAG: tetratricopeptide repeat protein [Runella sp.]
MQNPFWQLPPKPMTPSLLVYLLLWIWDNRSFDTISRSNRAKAEAQAAYLKGDYAKAIEGFEIVAKASIFNEIEVRFNLAHAYFQAKQYQKARKYYARLAQNKNTWLASRAYTQLGMIATAEKDTSVALMYFKQSLRQNPNNATARYNYELLKRRFKGNEQTPPSAMPTIQKTPVPMPPPPTVSSQEIQKSEQKKEILNRLQNIKMTEEQALILLEALKNAEIQYIQQQKPKGALQTDDSKGKW